MRRSCVLLVALLAVAAACSKGDKAKQTDASSSAARDTARTTTASVTYRAFGNEPFWAVTIDPQGLHFVSPDDTAGTHFPGTEPVASGDTLHWAAKSDRGSIDVRIWPGQCSDGMSDKVWSLVSAVRLNEVLFAGCADQSLGRPGVMSH